MHRIVTNPPIYIANRVNLVKSFDVALFSRSASRMLCVVCLKCSPNKFSHFNAFGATVSRRWLSKQAYFIRIDNLLVPLIVAFQFRNWSTSSTDATTNIYLQHDFSFLLCVSLSTRLFSLLSEFGKTPHSFSLPPLLMHRNLVKNDTNQRWNKIKKRKIPQTHTVRIKTTLCVSCVLLHEPFGRPKRVTRKWRENAFVANLFFLILCINKLTRKFVASLFGNRIPNCMAHKIRTREKEPFNWLFKSVCHTHRLLSICGEIFSLLPTEFFIHKNINRSHSYLRQSNWANVAKAYDRHYNIK